VAVTHGSQRSARRSALQQAGEQGLLCEEEDMSALPMDIGYQGPAACAAADITYRQLDYWARTRLVEPSVPSGGGASGRRLYSLRDILVLAVVKRLLDTGISLQQIRAAVAHLRGRAPADLAKVTLMSDGVSVYECSTADEVADLLQGGQGVFGIALGRVWRELAGSLQELPGERLAAPPDAEVYPADELAQRRRRRTG
jgi:DNA-binding transcriptional MerR regulator